MERIIKNYKFIKNKWLFLIVICGSILTLLYACTKDPEIGTYLVLEDGTFAVAEAELIYDAVTDYDGNSYDAVKIGNQTWMAENLRATHYADGASISQGNGTSTTTAYWYYPNNNSSNKTIYGLLYNWPAVMRRSSSSSDPGNVQGICPTGWHVPSDVEWTELTDYVSNQSQYVCGSARTDIAKALAGITGWESSTETCAIGNAPANNNATGFNALPAGGFYDYGYSDDFGGSARFWSATTVNTTFNAWLRVLYSNSSEVYRNYGNWGNGYSVRCLRDEGSSSSQIPTVTTSSVSSINTTSASCGGNVTHDGGATVSDRGVCWSTSHNPTTSNSHTTNGSGTGNFTSNITGLTAGKTYYVRAYATNSVGTAYGSEVSFTTSASIPTVTTSSVSSISSTSASCGGNVTHDGGATVTARGVCWSTNHNPTTSNSHTTNGSGTGNFTCNITGLTAGTTYYVRAYATNSMGTAYGSERSFTTTMPFTCGTSTLTDASGNYYNTVQIGTQCWMKENLRTKKYANGTIISQGSSTSTTTAYWYYPDNNSSNMSTYGLLYNWKAVMGNSSSSSANPSGVQGICPIGWHVPSDEEWKQMEIAVGMSQSDANNTGWRGSIAAQLCGNTGWQLSTTDNAAGNTSAIGRNSSGFSALPAGYFYSSGTAYADFGSCASFWSATEYNSSNAWPRDLRYNHAEVNRTNCNKYYGSSVRCVKD